MPANQQSESAGRALIWMLVTLAAIAGVGVPIYRAASQNSVSTSDTSLTSDSGVSVPQGAVPGNILQLFQKQANSLPWNQDSPAKTQAILQRCAALQQLLASGPDDETLSNALAASTLRASIFMAFGESLAYAGDNHHAEMLFASVVQNHSSHATAKQLARSHLWLAKLNQDAAIALKYQQSDPVDSAPLFQTAATHYLAAKDASQDWVRGDD